MRHILLPVHALRLKAKRVAVEILAFKFPYQHNTLHHPVQIPFKDYEIGAVISSNLLPMIGMEKLCELRNPIFSNQNIRDEEMWGEE